MTSTDSENCPPRSSEYLLPEVDWNQYNDIPAWKRNFDRTLIFLSSPIWLPLMILIAAWIRLVSPGPVFFLQKRVGLRGKRFNILKFRSMKMDAGTDSHENHFDDLVRNDRPMTKLDSFGDERLIFSGFLLRATALDELPQLINVLRGEMSLVGPRPCTPRELTSYKPYQLERFNAAPGLTGLWQVSGKNKTTFSEMVDFDIFYSRHATVRMDLGIVLKTVPTLVVQACAPRRSAEPVVARGSQTAKLV